jgi:hypothetical protein
MARYEELPSSDELKNPLECLTHKLMFIPSGSTQ